MTMLAISILASLISLAPIHPPEPSDKQRFFGNLTSASIDSADLDVHVRIQSDTVRAGEPLLATVLLRNASPTLQYIPADPAHMIFGGGWIFYVLIDSLGNGYRHTPEVHVDRIWPASNAFPVPPGESVYYRQLLWPERFFLESASQSRWAGKAGSYRLAATLGMPRFSAKGWNAGWFWVSDTTDLFVVGDTALNGRLAPNREQLQRVLRQGPIFAGAPATDSLLRALRVGGAEA